MRQILNEGMKKEDTVDSYLARKQGMLQQGLAGTISADEFLLMGVVGGLPPKLKEQTTGPMAQGDDLMKVMGILRQYEAGQKQKEPDEHAMEVDLDNSKGANGPPTSNLVPDLAGPSLGLAWTLLGQVDHRPPNNESSPSYGGAKSGPRL